MLRKFSSILVVISFFASLLTPVPQADAQSLLGLPEPGTMVSLSPAYNPAMIKGLVVHKDNPFIFDFIVDEGQDHLIGAGLKIEGEKLIKYFLAGLTIPEKDLWVNLSPYEKDRIIPEVLGQTAMGRDLLAQDYILKQITASLIYPDENLGKMFWDKVYTKAQQLYGTTQVPVNTFNKVWITADRAEVYEHNNTAFVVDCHLKVMLEEDYLALKKHVAVATVEHSIDSQIVREIILPELEKEVNTGKNFVQVRQIFNSIILASWYKNSLKQALLNQVYANKSKVKGIDLLDKTIKEKIYRRYLQAYKKGVFNLIKEDLDPVQGVTVPRKYFSGGVEIAGILTHPDITEDRSKFDSAMSARGRDLAIISTRLMDNPPAVRELIPDVMPPEERKHYLGTVYRNYEIKNGKIIEVYRISEIWDPLFSPQTKKYVLKQVGDGTVAAVYVKESIIRQAEKGDIKIILGPETGKVSKNLWGTEVTLGRTSSEVIKQPISDPLRKAEHAEELVVRAGGYFRIKEHDDISGEDMYLLTFNRKRPEKLTPPGGGSRFVPGGKTLYRIAGLGNMWVFPVSELDDSDPLAIRVAIKGEKCWTRFLKLFNNGVGREQLLPVREFYEELVGPQSDVHLFQDDRQISFRINGHPASPLLPPSASASHDFAIVSHVPTNGGIDLNTQNMKWNIRRDGNGVEMNIDAAMVERVKREGIDSLTPVIFRITPVTNIWPLVGLQSPTPTTYS